MMQWADIDRWSTVIGCRLQYIGQSKIITARFTALVCAWVQPNNMEWIAAQRLRRTTPPNNVCILSSVYHVCILLFVLGE